MKLGKLPSEVKKNHNWKTRKDPFKDDWERIKKWLENDAGLEAKFILDYLQHEYPDKYSTSHLRTLQRRVKKWKAAEGPPKEVYFPQVHKPGELCQSDFTDLSEYGVTIQGKKFDHLLYHFVLTYSNWETGTICFSESFESLSLGLQNALWKLGGMPKYHQTDRLSAAVNNLDSDKDFTEKYKALLRFLRIEGKKINARCANENGDVEQSHYRFQRALEQRLIFRGSKDFADRVEYENFLNDIFKGLNSRRNKKLNEELRLLRELPKGRMDSFTEQIGRVSKFSTVTVGSNAYSVYSSLRGENVKIRIHSEFIEVWYAGQRMHEIPRLLGRKKHSINYRHIIDSLVRKPGAFRGYQYQSDLFPTTTFKVAYDRLNKDHDERKADKEYVKILYLAATKSESLVDNILNNLIYNPEPLTVTQVEQQLEELTQTKASSAGNQVEEPDLDEFDQLLDNREVA